MIKTLTKLALISTSVVQAQEGETPPPLCPDNTITKELCSRSINQSSTKTKTGNIMQMQYWVDLQNQVPTFHAHMVLTTKNALDGKKPQLKICIEFGTEESKDSWREQIMINADTKAAAKGSETTIEWGKQLVYKKAVDASDLANGLKFCSYTAVNTGFIKDESQPDYVEHHHKGDISKGETTESKDKKDLFVDWKRAFTESNENAMDFEAGKSYVVYMSYYYDLTSDQKETDSETKVYGDVDTKNKNYPNFSTIYLQNLDIPDDAPEESNYTVKTGAIQNLISWGTLTSMAATSYAMF